MTPSLNGLLARVEDAGLNASAPTQQRLMDGWLLRFCPGKAKRARAINAIAAGRLPVAEKLERCAEAYREAKLPMIVRITPFSEPLGLDEQLEAAGLARFDDTRVMVHPAPAQLAHAALPNPLRIKRVGHESFARLVGSMRGSTVAMQQAHAQRLVQSPVKFEPYVLDDDGVVLCCAQVAVEFDLVGLYDVFTAPRARGRGYAGMLCSQLLTQSKASTAYLQVEAGNSAARAVYARLGFSDAYAYHYRTKDPNP